MQYRIDSTHSDIQLTRRDARDALTASTRVALTLLQRCEATERSSRVIRAAHRLNGSIKSVTTQGHAESLSCKPSSWSRRCSLRRGYGTSVPITLERPFQSGSDLDHRVVRPKEASMFRSRLDGCATQNGSRPPCVHIERITGKTRSRVSELASLVTQSKHCYDSAPDRTSSWHCWIVG